MHERAAVLGLLGTLAAFAAPAPAVPLEIRERHAELATTERITTPEPGQAFALRLGVPLGELELSAPWSDFRGQTIAAGRYALRYALQPRLKDHVGADTVRDFALLVPRDAEGPDWIAASRRASGTGHPAVMALLPWRGAESPPESPQTLPDGKLAHFREVGGLRIGFVVAGRAALPEL